MMRLALERVRHYRFFQKIDEPFRTWSARQIVRRWPESADVRRRAPADVNATLEGRVTKADGSFGGNPVHGEIEIAVPGRIKPEQVEQVYEVVRTGRGLRPVPHER